MEMEMGGTTGAGAGDVKVNLNDAGTGRWKSLADSTGAGAGAGVKLRNRKFGSARRRREEKFSRLDTGLGGCASSAGSTTATVGIALRVLVREAEALARGIEEQEPRSRCASKTRCLEGLVPQLAQAGRLRGKVGSASEARAVSR